MCKKMVSALLCGILAVSMLTGCGNDTAERTGQVYYLNFKPEVDEVWQELAASYTEQTGVPVKVVTAASNTYEQTLRAEIGNGSNAPTLFQINGPIGYLNWQDYCANLSDTNLYSWLLDKSLAVTGADGGVYGIPYVVEGYGIIYNDAIMQQYFALDGAVVSSMDEVNNFATLKAVVEDMTAKKDDLGIQGVFASTSFSTGEDWRWQTHLANIPVYYEYRDKGIVDTDDLDFTYSRNLMNIFDLYINNSCTARTLLTAKTVEDSMGEFARGEVAMVQNGNWGWSQIAGADGNVVTEENIKFLPIYTGIAGEEAQGLCVGTENFFSVNSQASAEDQAASIAFVEWLFSSDEGKEAVTNKLGFIAPFSTFDDDEKPVDPLAQEVLRYMSDSSKVSVSWIFTTFPSEQFKYDLGQDLAQYAAEKIDWNTVADNVVEKWASMKAEITE